MRTVLMLAMIASLAGCSLGPRVQLGAGDGPGNKVVTGKEEPATLVAADGTLCLVPPARFERTKSGDRVWCNWRQRGAGQP